jgi:flagellar assembly factor FliW
LVAERRRPELAFVVTDPRSSSRTYDVPVREETQADIALTDTKRAGVRDLQQGRRLADREPLGPIVVNAENRLATQVVLTEKKWTTRQPLYRLTQEVPLAKSA